MIRLKISLRLALLVQVLAICMQGFAVAGGGGGACVPPACSAEGCVVDDNVYVTEDDCKESEECVFEGKACRRKGGGSGKVKSGKSKSQAAIFGFPKKSQYRNLRFGPPPLPGCIPPPEFPTFCNPKRNEPYVVDPPLNIPYCVRIPCSLDRQYQAEYDSVHRSCGMQPGCYFDRELFDLREAFGPGVLPGVPVCHLAIRTKFFFKQANKVVEALGDWNPYFTKCALDTARGEIDAEHEGCQLIPLLKAFKIQPKMCGWGSIISGDCRLLGCCWIPGEGCFYPVGSDVEVKSWQKFRYDRHEMIFGRPKCQGFDPSTPYSFLKSYHQCLKSGCTIDTSTTVKYYQYLFKIGNSMSVENHWKYWKFVESGEIGPFNIDKIGWDYDKSYTGEEGSDIGSGPKIPFAPPPPKPAGNPFSVPGRRRRGINPPWAPPPPFNPNPPAKPQKCGEIFKNYGGRPCPPPPIPELHRPKICPFVPFSVPRFDPLKGSFEGCCDVNLCYLSKHDIRSMHSGPAYYYSEWSYFTPCPVTCGGGGIRQRFRKCVAHDQKLCTEEVMQEDSCGNNPCPQWGPWSRYTPCPGNGCGIQTRKRECLPPGAHCDEGQPEENRRCSRVC